ncbi:hypothetical protein HW555_003919 [Spodoptera exigua]|uniref:Uncharacterized protein n=1 Tax=Spodoptera exigua TaxID=7107 RepID=A0A835GJC0_SPOEX|nr:hypothetical protein HW555_003919 [Spodoptera exigua]
MPTDLAPALPTTEMARTRDPISKSGMSSTGQKRAADDDGEEITLFLSSVTSSSSKLLFDYANVVSRSTRVPPGVMRVYYHRDSKYKSKLKDDIYDQPVNLMNKKSPHAKEEPSDVRGETNSDPWSPFDFSKFDKYLNDYKDGDKQDTSPEHNRIKRRARNVRKFSTMLGPQLRERPHHYTYPEPVKDRIMEFTTTTKKPGIMPDQMNPGVIFRVRMSDAILRIKQRMYEDPERHIEADIIYTNLIKKVVMDEITKFHNLLLMYKTDKSIKEHLGECGGRIYKFISYMTIKVHIYCLFDALWIDGNPYVIGDEYSVTPVEVPPMLQCDAAECNSIRRRGRGGRRRGRQRVTTNPPDDDSKNGSSTEVPIARAADIDRKGPINRSPHFDMYEPPGKEWESGYVEMPKDLYQAHLRPGVIFRIHMSEAILKMQYRNYGEDKDESVIEADVEYLRLTRKVINDEITKFEDLQWLIGWFHNRSELIKEHLCNTRYYTVGTPPTMFTHSEEYMKRLCLFDSVYIDHIPYVIGEDSSIMAAVAPPVLHCDAASCTSVPFIDSVMFDERLPRTNVRTLTRCQASCRAHCRNDPDCLKRCSDRCLRSD